MKLALLWQEILATLPQTHQNAGLSVSLMYPDHLLCDCMRNTDPNLGAQNVSSLDTTQAPCIYTNSFILPTEANI